jgi:carbon monoxide dehydrogenase subunit G
MARYCTTIESTRSPEACFAALSDFSSAQEWDPGVARASRPDDGAVDLGSRFDLVASFMGREVPLTYEIIAFSPPHRVVLRAENETVVSLDEITFAPAPAGGTLVTYDADLRLKGVLRPFDLGLRLVFKRIGDQAAAGLRTYLA